MDISYWLPHRSGTPYNIRSNLRPQLDGFESPAASSATHEDDEDIPYWHAETPENVMRGGNEKMYEAFSELHRLARDFDRPLEVNAN